MIPNRILIGNRGSGKSVSLETMMTEIADEAAILLIDWPGTLADRMTGRMWERGRAVRLIVDKASWTDRVPQWPFRPEPAADDRLTRSMGEEAANEEFLQALFARRYESDGTLSPNTYRSALAAIEVYYGIEKDARPPINYLRCLFRPRDPIGQWMLAESRDREAANVFLDAERFARRSPQQWDYLLGAGGRLLDVLGSPAIWMRNGESLDWKAVIRNRQHYYLGMEGLPQTVATSLAVLTYSAAIRAARELFEETGRPHLLVVVLEEAGALSLVTPLITRAMQAYRKHGVSVWLAAQTIHDFRDEETLESVLSMSEHYWHQMTAGVDRAAADCAVPTYDPNRVLHIRERPQVQRYERVTTRSVTTDSKSKLRRTTRSEAFSPVLGVQIEESYDTPANHEAEFRARLSTLKVGERFFRGLDGLVRKESVSPSEDPWGPFADDQITLNGETQALARHRLESVVKRVRTSPIYQPPPVWTLPTSPPASAPAPIPTRATEEAPSGMRGS